MRWETFWLCALFALLAATIVAAKVRDAQDGPSFVVKGINVLRIRTPVDLAIQHGPPTGGGPLFRILPQRVAFGVVPSSADIGSTRAKSKLAEPPSRPIAKAGRSTRAHPPRTSAKKNTTDVKSAATAPLFGQTLAPVEREPDALAAFDTPPAAPRAGMRSHSLQGSGFASEREASREARPHVAIPLGDRTSLTVGSAATLWPSNKVIETRSQSLNDPSLTDRLGREVDEPMFSGAAVGFKFKLN